jgi:pimeloyl-ACP methyl ester carboxylesterase
VNEHPVFVPHRGDHLAAVIALPEHEPRSLVVLLQGLGAPRSHKNRFWTRMARELAAQGLASVRIDYPEFGDSTGSLEGRTYPLTDEAMVVTQFALETTGLERYGVAGNCLGAWTGFAMAAADRRCVSVASLLLGSPENILEGQGRTAVGRAARRTARRAPRMRRFARRLLRTERIDPRMRFRPEVPAGVASANSLFLFLGKEDLGRSLALAVSELHHEPGRICEVRTMPILGTSGFQLPLDVQPEVMTVLVDWLDQTLPGEPGREPEAAISARRAGPAA